MLADQGQIGNVQFEEKMGTRTWNGAKSYVQGLKQITSKGNDDLRAKPHPGKLKKFLVSTVVVPVFILSSQREKQGNVRVQGK